MTASFLAHIEQIAKQKMNYFRKLDNANSIEIPVKIIELSEGIEAQIIIKVITEKHDFLYCENYYTK